ncbi:MAG: MFS transporter [Conexivisphaerales archaeon]
MTDQLEPTVEYKTGLSLKVSIAALTGLTFEFYDFLIFGFLASTLGALFFPSSSAIASALLTFTSFATGYLLRPIGAIVFGHMGDKIGRKYTLITTVTLMGIASLFTGLLPGYSEIGVFAPVLLTALRMLMGFSLGGEMGGSYTLTAETSKPRRRGAFLSITTISVPLSIIMTTTILAFIRSSMTAQQFLAIGWRIPFFIGVIIAVVGAIIRLTITESSIFNKFSTQKKLSRLPIKDAIRYHWKQILRVVGLISGGTVITYMSSVFIVSYLVTVVKVSPTVSSLAVSLGYLTYLILAIPCGFLADRIGRKTNLLVGVCGLILFIYPYFVLLGTGSFENIVLAQSILGVFQALYTTGWTPLQTELFPTNVRYTALSIGAQTSLSFFGGFTPLIATYLIYATGFRLAPIYWAVAMLTVTLVSTLTVRETKGINLEF